MLVSQLRLARHCDIVRESHIDCEPLPTGLDIFYSWRRLRFSHIILGLFHIALSTSLVLHGRTILHKAAPCFPLPLDPRTGLFRCACQVHTSQEKAALVLECH